MKKSKLCHITKLFLGFYNLAVESFFANIVVDTNKTIFGVQWQKIKQSFDRYCQ